MPAPDIRYTITHRGQLVAEAETFAGATCALRTLRDEMDEPSALSVVSRRGSVVAGIGPDGHSVLVFQGAETWA